MRFFKPLAWIALIVGIGAFLATFPVEVSFASRARLYQRAEPSAESALFGDAGDKIGSPQEMIIDAPRAVLSTQGDREGRAG